MFTMKIFFATRFTIIFLFLSIYSALDYGAHNIIKNIGGVAFSLTYFSIVLMIIYCFTLAISSILVGLFHGVDGFKIGFSSILLADNLFLYIFVGLAMWLFLTDGGTGVSVAGHEGALVVNGVKTVLGWRKAAESTIDFILLIIGIHILFLLHNYISNKNR